MELPGRDPALEDRPRTGLRQHGGVEAVGADPSVCGADLRGARRGRAAAGCPEPRDRLSGRYRRVAHPASGGGRDLVHRVGACRPRNPCRRGRPRGQGAARARRQEPRDRAARRRPRPGRCPHRARGDALDRAAVHRDEPGDRRRTRRRRVLRTGGGARAIAAGRRPARPGRRAGTARVRGAASARRRLPRDRPHRGPPPGHGRRDARHLRRPLRDADCVRRRRPVVADRAGGDLRPRPRGHAGSERRRGDRDRKQRPLRPLGIDLHQRPGPGARLRPPHPGGRRAHQLRDAGSRAPRPVRRRQGLELALARAGRRRDRLLHRHEDGVRRSRWGDG